MAAPPPPRPAKPGNIRVFRALYPYASQQPDELSFEEGDLIYVAADLQNGNGWWTGTCKGRKGLIPSNYVSEQTESVDFPLHEAAKRGNLAFLQESLAQGVSVNSLDKSGSTALYWACHSGQIDCVKVLLSQPNVSLNAQNKLGDSALHAAAYKGHVDIVSLLMQQGANASLKNGEKKTAYDLAKEPETAALLKRASLQVPLDASDYQNSGEDSD